MRRSTRLLPAWLLVAAGGAADAQTLDPGDFVAEIDNAYFPLVPGTVFTYEGKSRGARATDITTVTDRQEVILGVRCAVVHDEAVEDGVLVEDTLDYFAQDRNGNVWYFGEDTRELDEDGNTVSTEGTWRAGVDGARPGIVMEAEPRVGDVYRQEDASGVAEDMARVLSVDEELCVPAGCFDHVLLTEEWTPLEPHVFEEKSYAPGVGFVYGRSARGGGHEVSSLVSVSP